MPIDIQLIDQTTPTLEQQKAFLAAISALHKDNYSDYPWSEEWCAMYFREFCLAKNMDVFMAVEDGVILGFGVGACSNLWYSPQRQYDEVIVAIAQAGSPMQNARVTKKLLDSLEWAAGVRKCQVMCVGTSTGCKSDAYLRVLERRGFHMFGTAMRKVL